MDKKLSSANFFTNQPVGLVVLRAFAVAFPSLEAVPWRDVLSLAQHWWAKDEDRDNLLDRIRRGFELSGNPDPDQCDRWEGELLYDELTGIVSIRPNVWDRWVQILFHKHEDVYEIRIDCSARPSRQAMSHLIDLVENSLVTPVRSSWVR